MKIINSVIGVFLLQTFSLFGDVTFEFIYEDKPETGFHSRPEAKAALEEVGRLIGSDWLKRHDANIVIKVSSVEEPEASYFAYYSELLGNKKNINEFHRSNAEKKIILGQKNENKYDVSIVVNFGHPFSFGDEINPSQYDFKSILIHEITHALGFTSPFFICPVSDEARLAADDYLHYLLIFGKKQIEGEAESIESYIKKLAPLFEKQNIVTGDYAMDVDRFIYNKFANASSKLEALYTYLLFCFKVSLDNSSRPFTSHKELFEAFSDHLARKGMTIQEFIQFDHDNGAFLPRMVLGFQKLAENISDPLEEEKLRETLLTYDLLHDDFGAYVIKKLNKSLIDPQLADTFQQIIFFYTRYLITGEIDHEELKKINELRVNLALDNLSIDQIVYLMVAPKLIHSYFNQFVVTKDGKKFFEGKLGDNIRKTCFSKEANKQLFFSGPNTLKYIGSAIPLNHNDTGHISYEISSIMNPAAFTTASINPSGKWRQWDKREWDASTTAIMLDLGYNIDNYWTRLWGHGKSEEKSATKESRDPLPKKKEKNRAKQNSKIKDTKSAKKKRTTETKAKKTASKEKKAKGSKAIKSAKKKRTTETKPKKKASRAKKTKGNKAVKAA